MRHVINDKKSSGTFFDEVDKTIEDHAVTALINQIVALPRLPQTEAEGEPLQFYDTTYISLDGWKLNCEDNYQEKVGIETIINLIKTPVRIDITNATLNEAAKKFFAEVRFAFLRFQGLKKVDYPLRICQQINVTQIGVIRNARQSLHISEIILIGTMPPLCKTFDVSNMDISRIELVDSASLEMMKLTDTKINRKQFLYLKERNFRKRKRDNINLSLADLTNIDLRSVDIEQFQFCKTQNLSGCMITAKQANYLADKGIDLTSVKIYENNDFVRLNEKTILQKCKINISAKQLEDLLLCTYPQDVDLTCYHIKLPELKNILATLHKHPLFRNPAYSHLLRKFISFTQRHAEIYSIEKIVLSNMIIRDANFCRLDLERIVFNRCRFINVNFTNTRCEQTEFRHCKFMKCDFDEMYISPKTVFEKADFQFEKNVQINAINYKNDDKYVQLNPIRYYEAINQRHEKLLAERKKPKLFHGFFDKTEKQLKYPNRSFLAIVFSFFLDHLLRRHPTNTTHTSRDAFIGMLLIEKHRKEKTTGVTNTAAQEFLAQQHTVTLKN